MRITQEHTVHSKDLITGIIANELPINTSAVAHFIHGDIRDLDIHYNGIKLSVITRNTIEFMNAWGLHKQIKLLQRLYLRFDTYQGDSAKKANVLTFNFDTKSNIFNYKCDSRTAFATLNQIKNSLNMLKNMSSTQKGTIIAPTENMLMHYCLQPVSHATDILKEFTNRNLAVHGTLTMLDTPRFKHKLKLIHPTTTWLYDNSSIKLTGIKK